MNARNLQKPLVAARLVAVLLIILLFPAGISAAQTLVAEVIAWPAVQQLQAAQDRQVSMPDRKWQDIRIKLQKALSLEADKPEFLHHLGNAWLLQYRYASNSDETAIAAREQAAEYFRQAMTLRPTWPHDRVDYLLAKYRLQDIDSEFYRQLLMANRLGPWEAWVQQITAETGLQLGDQLPADVRDTVAASIINGVQHPDDFKIMLDILRRYNSLDLVCGEVPGRNVVEYCNRYH